MQTARLNFTGARALKKGGSYRLSYQFRQPNGQPVDFSGATAISQIRKSPTDTNPISWICNFDSDRASGKFEQYLPSSATSPDAIETGRYFCDLRITFASGDVWYVWEGDVDIKWSASRA